MPRPKHRVLISLTVALLAVTAAVTVAPRAYAKTYSDVPKTHWAHAAITAVTDRGVSGHWLLDDYGGVFKPEKAVLRSEMARALVSAAGRQSGETYTPVAIGDVPPEHPYYADIQLALKYKFMALDEAGNFRPRKP